LDVLKVVGDVDGGLTGERAVALLCSPLAGMDPRGVARLGRHLRRRAAALGDEAPASSYDLIARSLRDQELLDGADRELAAPVLSVAQILDRAGTAVADRWPTVRILDQVWRATDWPKHLRRDALGGGRRAREANQALDAVMELFDQAEQMDRAFESVRPVAQFLEQLDQQIIPAAPDLQKGWNRQAVRLVTAHRAKGSQWPLVVVAGVQEGLWPDLRARGKLLTGAPDAGWREQQSLEERRLFFVACTRASRALLVTAVNSSADDGPTASPYLALAAGDREVVVVPGRPRRPLTPTGVVAGLRQILDEPGTSPAMRTAVWQRLLDLAEVRDSRGVPMFPWADPVTWWGRRQWTRNPRPWFDPDQPLPLSASGVESYVQCPRRWFLEKRVRASTPATTSLAFGNLLHLCAQAIASGELVPDEQAVGDVLDTVWHAVGYEQGWQASYEREQAQQATQRLLTWMATLSGEFVGAEVAFDTAVTLPSGEILQVRGKADRVDKADEQIVITDFKTGKTTPSRAEVAEHIQLSLYRWIAEMGALGVDGTAVAQLLYLRQDPPRTQHEPGARLMRQDAPDLSWLTPVLESAVAGLRAELAVARPGPGCRTCPVADSCPADPRGAEVRP
jgi:RecB family exonuclease